MSENPYNVKIHFKNETGYKYSDREIAVITFLTGVLTIAVPLGACLILYGLVHLIL